MGTFFAQVWDVSAIINKWGIITGDFILQVTMTRKSIRDTRNYLKVWTYLFVAKDALPDVDTRAKETVDISHRECPMILHPFYIGH